MRETVCLIAPAVLMIILVRFFTKKKIEVLEIFFEFIIFIVLNNACVFLLLAPFHKVGLILGDHGEMNVYYGGVAILTSIVVAIGLSFFMIFVYKNIRIELRLEESIGEK